ncbi:hypothetical protein evm_005285 [Chilo suppressalis]|nr:hypothetical protein evm_015471 [Chilo suppressalis]RVE50079.1 hypothetical protein evm_005285 [Chilo suppressalis]
MSIFDKIELYIYKLSAFTVLAALYHANCTLTIYEQTGVNILTLKCVDTGVDTGMILETKGKIRESDSQRRF